jgi:tetratricopeptide (TPR) repeat protein
LAYLTAEQALGDRSLQQRRLDWFSGLGESLAAQARFSEATDAYESMRAAAELLGDLVAEAHAWNGLAFVQERRGANRVSVDCASRAAELATRAGSSAAAQPARARALFLKGWAFYRLGDAAAVLAHGEQALALCTELGADYEKTNCLKLIAVGHLLLGHHDQADEFFQQSLALSRALGYRRNVGAMLSNLGESARSRGDYEAAVRHYQEAIAQAREIGNVESELLYLSNLGGAFVGLGRDRLAAAETHLKQVIAHERQQVFLFSETYRFLAEALLGQGKVAEALDAARRALALGERTENQDHIAAAWRALGKVSAHPDSKEALQQLPASDRARFENAGACFAESLKIYSAMGADADRARTLRAWAACELQRGDRARGTEMWQEARQIFGRLGMPLEMQRMNAEERELAD